jgi:hypothetical protein
MAIRQYWQNDQQSGRHVCMPPETCAPTLNSRNKRPLQWLHWHSRSYGDRDGDGNNSARLKAERSRFVAARGSLWKNAPLIYGIMMKIIRLTYFISELRIYASCAV